jgi:hypothetical protein
MFKNENGEKSEAIKIYLCFDGILGCGNSFDKNSFRFDGLWRISTLCDRCEAKVAMEYGVEMRDAAAVGCALANMDWYYEQIPTANELDMRTKIRILLLASMVIISLPLESEIGRAEKLRIKFPILGASVFRTPELREILK